MRNVTVFLSPKTLFFSQKTASLEGKNIQFVFTRQPAVSQKRDLADLTMRICILNEFFHPDTTGGTGTVLSNLARTLCDNYTDVQIDVVTSRYQYRGNKKLAPFENWRGIRIRRLFTPRASQTSTAQRLLVNILFSLAAMLRLLVSRRYDLILVGTAPPPLAMAAHWIKRLRGTPYIYIIYDLEPDRAVAMKVLSPTNRIIPLVARMQKHWLHACSKAVVLGRCMRDHLKETYALPASQISVIPIGADPEDIAPLDKQTRFRAEQAIDGFVMLYSGNFGRYHNFDTILDAAKLLQAEDKPITFVLVGSGHQKEHIEQRIQAEHIDNVKMFPFVAKEDYPDLLASCDVSLVTLEPGMEGLCVPSKFYSILASGRPTLAVMSPDCEVAKVIAEADCGVQVNQSDTAQLACVLTELAESPARVEQMGKNARRALVQNYTSIHVAEQYYRVFAEALGRTVSESPAGLSVAAVRDETNTAARP